MSPLAFLTGRISNISSRTVLLIVFCIGLISIAWYVHAAATTEKPVATNTIMLTASGFEPKSIIVREGDTVTFSGTEPFWPASNPHPTHTVYTPFDPQRPVTPPETWSFTFTKAGVWHFHDHLQASFTGTVFVMDEDGTVPTVACARAETASEKAQCWEDSFNSMLKNKGVKAAFELLATLYEKDPVFAAQCHSYTHLIGATAYREFADGSQVALPPETAYCGFGFYHGFMEELLHTTNNPKEAQDFCAYADKTFGGDAKGACYHGIGHGFVDGSDPRAKTPQALMENGLAACNFIGENDEFISRCASGVFNGIAIYLHDPANAAHRTEEYDRNPYSLCANQTDENFKIACYDQMNIPIFNAASRNLIKAFSFVKTIPDPEYQRIAVESLPALAYGADRTRYTNEAIVRECRTLGDPLGTACIRGFASGSVELGPPGQEEARALSLCGYEELHPDERNNCFGQFLPYLKITHLDRYAATCAQLPEEYKTYCTN